MLLPFREKHGLANEPLHISSSHLRRIQPRRGFGANLFENLETLSGASKVSGPLLSTVIDIAGAVPGAFESLPHQTALAQFAVPPGAGGLPFSPGPGGLTLTVDLGCRDDSLLQALGVWG